jgi:hypothetical protein
MRKFSTTMKSIGGAVKILKRTCNYMDILKKSVFFVTGEIRAGGEYIYEGGA